MITDITYTSSLSSAGDRVPPGIFRVDRRGTTARPLVSCLSDCQHMIVERKKLKNPTVSAAWVSDCPTPWRVECISLKSRTQNVSGGLRVCSGRLLGCALLVLIRLEEVHLLYFSQRPLRLLRIPFLSKQHYPTNSSPQRA